MIIFVFHVRVERVGFKEGKQLVPVVKLRFKIRSVLTLKPEVSIGSLCCFPKATVQDEARENRLGAPPRCSIVVPLSLGTGPGSLQQRAGELVSD